MRSDHIDPYGEEEQARARELLNWKRNHVHPSRWRGIWNFFVRLFK